MERALRHARYIVKRIVKQPLHFAATLRSLMEAKPVNASQLARETGMSHVAIGNYLKGRLPEREQAQALAKFFGVSIDSLLGQTGPTLIGTPPAIPDLTPRRLSMDEFNEAERTRHDEAVKMLRAQAEKFEGDARRLREWADELDPPAETKFEIPMFERIAAGFPVDVSDPIREKIAVPKEQSGEGNYALRVSGESMTGAGIHDGDIVVMASLREPRSGDIVAAWVDGESTLKRLITGAKPRLRAENPKFRDIIPKSELFIQGVMIGKLNKQTKTP